MAILLSFHFVSIGSCITADRSPVLEIANQRFPAPMGLNVSDAEQADGNDTYDAL